MIPVQRPFFFLLPVRKWFFKVITMLRGGLIPAPNYILHHKPNVFPDAGKNRTRDTAKGENSFTKLVDAYS